MRALLVLLAMSAASSGCMDLPPLRSRPAPSAPGPCGVQARQRLDDAIMAGEADGYERAIFNRAYQDCLAAVKRYGQP